LPIAGSGGSIVPLVADPEKYHAEPAEDISRTKIASRVYRRLGIGKGYQNPNKKSILKYFKIWFFSQKIYNMFSLHGNIK